MTELGTPAAGSSAWRAVDRVLAEVLRRLDRIEERLSELERTRAEPPSADDQYCCGSGSVVEDGRCAACL